MNWDNYINTHPYYTPEVNEEYKKSLVDFLTHFKIKYSKSKCLEIGAGHGIYTTILASIFKHITATEPNEILYKHLVNLKLPNVETINQSAEKVLLTDVKYDMIILMNVFFLLSDKKKVLKKFKKLLKPNGYILIMEPIKFIKFNKENDKTNKLMMETVDTIYKSNDFKILYNGIVLPNLMCYLLQLKK